MVILGGGIYYEEIKWPFPPVKECPHVRCTKTFQSRALTRKHYQKEHAKDFTFCRVCDKPIYAKKFGEHEQTAIHKISASKKPHIAPPVDLFVYR